MDSKHAEAGPDAGFDEAVGHGRPVDERELRFVRALAAWQVARAIAPAVNPMPRPRAGIRREGPTSTRHRPDPD